MTDQPPDTAVSRANQLTTTFLDTLGILLLAAAVGWWLWEGLGPASGLFAAGALILVMSFAAQHRGDVRPRPTGRPTSAPQPGPADAGNLHVMGR